MSELVKLTKQRPNTKTINFYHKFTTDKLKQLTQQSQNNDSLPICYSWLEYLIKTFLSLLSTQVKWQKQANQLSISKESIYIKGNMCTDFTEWIKRSNLLSRTTLKPISCVGVIWWLTWSCQQYSNPTNLGPGPSGPKSPLCLLTSYLESIQNQCQTHHSIDTHHAPSMII